MIDQLAILGGVPTRSSPYPVHSTIIDNEEEKAVINVLRGNHLSGFSARPGDRFLGGNKVKELEKDFSNYFNVLHSVSFNSATSALHGSISAAKIGPGDEVITTPYTMTATAASILMQNGIPVFADIEDRTYGLDPKSVREKINEHTKAILAVNLFGHACRLGELKDIAKENNLILIEDNSQAPGAYYHGELCGTIGDMGIQSLNYHKAIQTGEGGMLLTDNYDFAFHNQLKRNHGEVVVGKINHPNITNVLGWNYRLTEIQAAIGIAQIKKLDYFNKVRIDLASELTELLKPFDFLETPIIEKDCTHVFYQYPIKFNESEIGIPRSLFIDAMLAEGISVSEGLKVPLYHEPIFQQKRAHSFLFMKFLDRDINYSRGLCPLAEDIMTKKVFITDLCKSPNTSKEVEEFLKAVKKIVNNLTSLKKMNNE